jgi:signal transduction histidine kinase
MQQKKGREVEQIQTIQTLGQKALISLRDSLWSLDIKSDNGLQFWDRVKTIASESYGPLEIPYNISGINDMEKIYLSMLEKNYLLYIIKECITNSLKYGDRKHVDIRWLFKKNLHQIIISNGIGEINKSNHIGQGKYNINSRMKKIGGEAVFFKQENKYTVELTLNFLK